MKTPTTYILTDSDRDGLLAGYAAWRRAVRSGAASLRYHALGTGEGPERFTRDSVPKSVLEGEPGIVYVLDMTPSDKVLVALAERHHKVVVIDHHSSAADRIIDGLRNVGYDPGDPERNVNASWESASLQKAADVHGAFYQADQPSYVEVNHLGEAFGFFGSVHHSAAGLAWLFFFGRAGEDAPYTVSAVEDCDIWRHAVWGSKELCQGLEVALSAAGGRLAPRTQDEAKRTMEILDGWVDKPVEEARLVELGRPVLIYREGLAAEAASRATLVEFDTGEGMAVVPVASGVPRQLASLTGDVMCDAFPEAPFAIVFGVDARSRSFDYTLYSRGRADCGAIATRYGGGGHANAAGFTVRFSDDEPVSMFVPAAPESTQTPTGR